MKGEFEPIIDHVRDTAQDMVVRAAVAASDASGKINKDEYTTKDLILTMTQMVTIAVDGGAKITQKVVGETPAGAKHVAGFAQAVGRRMAKETRLVYKAATAKIDHGEYDVDDWIVSLTRLADIAIVGGMEIAETVLIGPGQFEDDALSFDLLAPESDQSRTFDAVSIRRFGPEDEAEIPAGQITFDPPRLGPGERAFTLLIKPKGLSSGVYHGEVSIAGVPLPVELTL